MNIRLRITAALLALLAAPAIGAAESWRMVTTEHFRVLSQANDFQTAKWIRDFEQFISATSEATSIKPRALPPLTIILFANDKAFTPYKMMRPDGKAAKVAGQFVRFGGASTIGVAMGSEQAETRRTIFHEATHWLMSVDPARQPTWYSEGIAEMLSTFEQAGSKVNWAKPIDSHLVQLQESGLLPLKEFLTRTDALQDQDRHDDRYYAQSWALMHFLMLSGDPALPKLLSQYLTLYKSKPGDETVREVFGDGLATVERGLSRYVSQQSFSFLTLSAASVREPPASVPAPPGVVEAALGFMALGVDRKELARQHARRATQLAPELAGGHEVLAHLADDANDYPAIRQHAEAAVRAGSRDSQIFLLMADALGRDSKGNYQETSAARILLYRQAIGLSPTRHELYVQLTGDLLFQDKPQAQDLLLLEQGQRRFQGDEWIGIGVAAVKDRLGGGNTALQAIQVALRSDSKLTDPQRRAAGTLRRNLLMRAMDAELDAALQKRDLSAARAIVARYRETAGGDADIAAYLNRRDSQFELNQLIDRVNAAMRDRNNAELNSLLDQILAHPAVTPDLKNMVETTRRNMR